MAALATIVLAKYLQPTELGILMAGEAFVGIFSFFFTMGFRNSMLKFASDSPDGFEKGLGASLGNALLIRTMIVIPICFIIFLLGNFFNHDALMIKVIIAYIFIEIFRSFTNLFSIVRKALGQFQLVAGLNIVDKISRLAVIIIVLKFIGGIQELLYAYLLVSFIKFLLSFLTTIRLCKPSIKTQEILPMVKESFCFGAFDYMENSQNKIDRLILNYILGPSAVAFYSIPSKLNRLIRVIPLSINHLFLPLLHKHSNDENALKKTVQKLILLVAATGIPISLAIYFFSEQVLSLCFDAKYAPAIKLAPLFAFIAVIWFLNTPASLLLALKSDHKWRNSVQFFSIVMNIILNLIMIPKFGIQGAVWATIIANFLKFIGLQYRCVTISSHN